jgi:prepilin peptidase CpaA
MHNWLLLAVVLLTLVAAVWDLRTGLIPNWLVLSGFAFALSVRVVLGSLSGVSGALTAIFAAVGGALVCALVPAIAWRARGMGGGDLKLFAACGAFVGPVVGVELQLYACLFACVYAVGLLVFRGTLLTTMHASWVVLTNALSPRARRRVVPGEASESIRFGPAICLASLFVLVSHWQPGV